MTDVSPAYDSEPAISVGLIEEAESVSILLDGGFRDSSGRTLAPGQYRVTAQDAGISVRGPSAFDAHEISLRPVDEQKSRFTLNALIGIDFHWQQERTQTYQGSLRIEPATDGHFRVINDISLEKYIASVICSEMRSTSPADLARAHAVISRSWLLAQLARKETPANDGTANARPNGEIIRYYDREGHADFDVCADDHCQRYQGIVDESSRSVRDAVMETRGRVLVHAGSICDARFSKCCGGVSEDFRTAWSEENVDYLVPVFDGPQGRLPSPPLTEEDALREYIHKPPEVFCNCTDDSILDRVLNPYDRKTRDFFRWRVELSAERVTELTTEKLGVNLGRILALQPVERGLSGRLKRLRLVGEHASLVIGKELEIRRALSPSHLYSSAFVVDTLGPDARPDAFVLHGAGWGHGVGLCQIGAAVMAMRGRGYEEILAHYYPYTSLERIYP